MEDTLEKHISHQYFPEISKAFLGNKKFQISIRNRNPDYNFQVNAHSLYNFAPRKLNQTSSSSSTSEKSLNHFTLRHSMHFGRVTIFHRYRPYKNLHEIFSLSYDTEKLGIVELVLRSTREKNIHNSTLRHTYTSEMLNSKTDFTYNTSGHFDFSTFVVYSFVSSFSNPFPLTLNHTAGLSLDTNLNELRIKSLNMFYNLSHEKHRLFFAHMVEDPTVDNFFGRFVIGYTRKSSHDVRTILKMVHDYKNKETEIDLVRESRIMEKAVIRNKITSGYNIGTSLTYHINDRVRITHSAETDLRRFFKMQENYKYGVKLELEL